MLPHLHQLCLSGHHLKILDVATTSTSPRSSQWECEAHALRVAWNSGFFWDLGKKKKKRLHDWYNQAGFVFSARRRGERTHTSGNTLSSAQTRSKTSREAHLSEGCLTAKPPQITGRREERPRGRRTPSRRCSDPFAETRGCRTPEPHRAERPPKGDCHLRKRQPPEPPPAETAHPPAQRPAGPPHQAGSSAHPDGGEARLRRPPLRPGPPLTLDVLHHADGAARVDDQHPRLSLRAAAAGGGRGAAGALLGAAAGQGSAQRAQPRRVLSHRRLHPAH